MQTKTDMIKTALLAGDTNTAIRIASKFFDRSKKTKLYQTAWGCINTPSTYRQIGINTDNVIAEAVADLNDRFAQ